MRPMKRKIKTPTLFWLANQLTQQDSIKLFGASLLICKACIKKNKEDWYFYNAGYSEFPPEEVLQKAKALIVPGSSEHVYQEAEWLTKAKDWMKEFDRKHPNVKFMGICFGAQLACESLGGKVDIMEQKKLDKNFFVLGPEVLNMKKEFYELPFVKASGVEPKETMIMLQAHGDTIVRMPENFVSYGNSKNCEVEMFGSKCGRYYGVQGHPEYALGQMGCWRAGYPEKSKKLKPEEIEQLRIELLKGYEMLPHENYVRSLCFYFLRN